MRERVMSSAQSRVGARKPKSTRRAVAIDGIRRARCVGERHVGIGPQKIERVARDTRQLMLRPPGEQPSAQAVAIFGHGAVPRFRLSPALFRQI